MQKKKVTCNPSTWLVGCIIKDQIKTTNEKERIADLKRQRDSLRNRLNELTPQLTPPGGRRRRIGGHNLAKPRGDQKRNATSMGGSMDETMKMQGHIDLLQEQQKIQKETHEHFVKQKEEELKAKDIEILHLTERLEKIESEQEGLRDKARMVDDHSDQMEAMRSKVVALEKQIREKDQKIRALDTNPEKFIQLQKYVHEELTRYVERIMRSLDDCKKSQTEAYNIIGELRKAITAEIAMKMESLGKKLAETAQANDAWSSRIGQQDQQLQKLTQELVMLRKTAHKLEVTFEAHKQQQSLQMLQGDTSSISSAVSPAGKTPVEESGLEGKRNPSSNKIDGMRSEVSRIDAAAIARQQQVDAMFESNTFMRKELGRGRESVESCHSELLTVSRKSSNANGHLNNIVRRLDTTQEKLEEEIQPAAGRANKLVSDLAERMHHPDQAHDFSAHGLSRSTPGFDQGSGSWYDMLKTGIKFTWE